MGDMPKIHYTRFRVTSP